MKSFPKKGEKKLAKYINLHRRFVFIKKKISKVKENVNYERIIYRKPDTNHRDIFLSIKRLFL